MNGEITFDLVMESNMPFVEGCYKLGDGIWHVFMFRKSRRGAEPVGVVKDIMWKSGVTGLNVIIPDGEVLNKSKVLEMMSEVLDVSEWVEVRGPDSMNLR